jgi:osmotically-inducible protein OsmY
MDEGWGISIMPENNGVKRLATRTDPSNGNALQSQLVQAAAQSRLRNSGYYELYLVSLEFHAGVLSLQGRVSSYYLKQVAQTLILGLDGVVELNNRLEVAATGMLDVAARAYSP